MSKILFLGGKSVGYGILQHLLLTLEYVVAVYANPSDEHPTWFPSLKPLLRGTNIPYLTENINTSPFIKKLDFDWIVCAYYDRIVKKHILQLPKRGALNVHLGIAEQYRGCYPTTFPIIDNRKLAGITIHNMTEGIDDGDVYQHGYVSVDPADTGKSLYYKCTGCAIDTFMEWWRPIKGGLPSTPQHSDKFVYHSREDFPSFDLSSLSPQEAERYGRALTFPPFERPYYNIKGKKIPIYYD